MAADEAERLRGFVLTVLEFVGLPLGDSTAEPVRNCRSVRELRAAASEAVELCQDLDSQAVDRLDELLFDSGYPTMSEMRDGNLRRLRRILAQQQIRNDDDWRFVESFVVDVDPRGLGRDDRVRANEMLAAYESSRADRRDTR